MPLATKDSFSSDKEEILDVFLRIQLDERTAKNTLANAKVTSSLLTVIHETDVTEGCDRAIGNLLYTVSTKYPANALVHRPTFLKYVVSSKIKTPAQLEAAFSFLTNIGSEDFKLEDFEERVAFPISPLKDREALLESHKDGYRIESQQRKDGLVAKSRLMTADDRGMGGYDDEMGYDPNPKPKMHMKGGKIGEDCEAVECEDYLN